MGGRQSSAGDGRRGYGAVHRDRNGLVRVRPPAHRRRVGVASVTDGRVRRRSLPGPVSGLSALPMEVEIATIGGYEAVGRQMTAVRAGDDVVIFDMGQIGRAHV